MTAESEAVFRKMGEAAAEVIDWEGLYHHRNSADEIDAGRAAARVLMAVTEKGSCSGRCAFAALPGCRLLLSTTDDRGQFPGWDCPMSKEATPDATPKQAAKCDHWQGCPDKYNGCLGNPMSEKCPEPDVRPDPEQEGGG